MSDISAETKAEVLAEALRAVEVYARCILGQTIDSDDPVIINYVRQIKDRAESALKVAA